MNLPGRGRGRQRSGLPADPKAEAGDGRDRGWDRPEGPLAFARLADGNGAQSTHGRGPASSFAVTSGHLSVYRRGSGGRPWNCLLDSTSRRHGDLRPLLPNIGRQWRRDTSPGAATYPSI
jgi:hypothetical protein